MALVSRIWKSAVVALGLAACGSSQQVVRTHEEPPDASCTEVGATCSCGEGDESTCVEMGEGEDTYLECGCPFGDMPEGCYTAGDPCYCDDSDTPGTCSGPDDALLCHCD